MQFGMIRNKFELASWLPCVDMHRRNIKIKRPDAMLGLVQFKQDSMLAANKQTTFQEVVLTATYQQKLIESSIMRVCMLREDGQYDFFKHRLVVS